MGENVETYLDPHVMNLQCQMMNYEKLLDENQSENSFEPVPEPSTSGLSDKGNPFAVIIRKYRMLT